jgi:hypothetical protein
VVEREGPLDIRQSHLLGASELGRLFHLGIGVDADSLLSPENRERQKAKHDRGMAVEHRHSGVELRPDLREGLSVDRDRGSGNHVDRIGTGHVPAFALAADDGTESGEPWKARISSVLSVSREFISITLPSLLGAEPTLRTMRRPAPPGTVSSGRMTPR